MGVNNLYQGQFFKNQRELCEFMGWKFIDSTNSKKAQLKTLSTICSWHKQGHKIIIDEVYSTSKAKNTAPRVQDVFVVDKDITNNLLKLVVSSCIKAHNIPLSEQTYTNVNQRTTIVMTEMDLLSAVGIVNSTGKLLNNKRYRQLVAYKNKLDVDMFDIATYRSLKNIKNSLTKALKELHNARLITYSNVIEIVSSPNKFGVFEYDDNGEILETSYQGEERFVATREQQDFISYITREVLNDYGCSNMRQMYNKVKDISQFYDSVNQSIRDKCVLEDNIERFGADIVNLQYIEKQFDKILVTFTGNLSSLKDIAYIADKDVENLAETVIRDSFKAPSNLIDMTYNSDKKQVYNSICRRDLRNAKSINKNYSKKDVNTIKNYEQSSTRSSLYPSMAKITSNIIYSDNPIISEKREHLNIINNEVSDSKHNRFGVNTLIRSKSDNSGMNELLDKLGEETFDSTAVTEHELVKQNFKDNYINIWGEPNPFNIPCDKGLDFSINDINDKDKEKFDSLWESVAETPKKKPLISDIQTTYVNEPTTIIIDDTLEPNSEIQFDYENNTMIMSRDVIQAFMNLQQHFKDNGTSMVEELKKSIK